MLSSLGPARGWEILQGLGNGDSPGKARDEIVDLGAI